MNAIIMQNSKAPDAEGLLMWWFHTVELVIAYPLIAVW